MPSRLTLAQIEDMLARDEAQLAAYRRAAAEAAADGMDPATPSAWPSSWRSGSACSAGREPSGSSTDGPDRRASSPAPGIQRPPRALSVLVSGAKVRAACCGFGVSLGRRL